MSCRLGEVTRTRLYPGGSEGLGGLSPGPSRIPRLGEDTGQPAKGDNPDSGGPQPRRTRFLGEGSGRQHQLLMGPWTEPGHQSRPGLAWGTGPPRGPRVGDRGVTHLLALDAGEDRRGENGSANRGTET